jgi:hypothetical protein
MFYQVVDFVDTKVNRYDGLLTAEAEVDNFIQIIRLSRADRGSPGSWAR